MIHILKNYPLINNDLCLYKMLNSPLVEYTDTVVDNNVQMCDRRLSDASLIFFDNDADCLRSYEPVTNDIRMFRRVRFSLFGNFTAIYLNPHIYILRQQKSVYRLDVSTENSAWHHVSCMITGHGAYPPCATLSGSLFVIGYGDRAQATSDVEVFHPVVNQWLKLADKPTPLCRAALVSLQDSIYCIGGWDGRQTIRSFSKFTPSLSKWIELTPMRKPRRSCGAVGLKTKIYVVGGMRGDVEKIQDVECYDVNTQQWTILSKTPNALGFSVAYGNDGCLFVSPRSGNAGGYSDEIQKYDIANDSWSVVKLTGLDHFSSYDCVLCLGPQMLPL